MSTYLRKNIIINFDTNQSRFTSFLNSHHNQGISDKILWSFFLPFTTFCGKTPFNCQKKIYMFALGYLLRLEEPGEN